MTVLKNDNLINICEKYLESPGDWKIIARINHLDNPHRIYPGSFLRIPAILLKGTPIDGAVSFINGQVMYRPPGSSDWTDLVMGDTVSQGSSI